MRLNVFLLGELIPGSPLDCGFPCDASFESYAFLFPPSFPLSHFSASLSSPVFFVVLSSTHTRLLIYTCFVCIAKRQVHVPLTLGPSNGRMYS